MKVLQSRMLERPTDGQATIERLKGEIMRLNDELTCASEAYQAIASENRLMKETLAIAAKAFGAAGDTRMANLMIGKAEDDKPQRRFVPPESRRLAAR
ncbi:hypothetical protein AB3480_32270 [Rhizobium mongolense]|uniref:hypothetical protein n=1 Tax=Rhizobium mongolense TaxID=57676 RepID=UPI0034A210EA